MILHDPNGTDSNPSEKNVIIPGAPEDHLTPESTVEERKAFAERHGCTYIPDKKDHWEGTREKGHWEGKVVPKKNIKTDDVKQTPLTQKSGSAKAPDTHSAQKLNLAPNAGSAAVTTWDSIQRGRYTAENVARSKETVEKVKTLTAEDNAVGAWEAAKEASEARNINRATTQARLSPGGRAMSEAIDQGRTFESMVAEYSTRAPGSKIPSPTRNAFTIAERVAKGSGRSNIWMSRLAKGGKVLGPLGVIVGLGVATKNILNAPDSERGKVMGGETGNFIGGMIGASAGTSAGVALAGGISGFLIGLGVVTGPVGWLALGLGMVGGFVGAWAFGNVGREAGEAIAH